jgi:hypothetical protein
MITIFIVTQLRMKVYGLVRAERGCNPRRSDTKGEKMSKRQRQIVNRTCPSIEKGVYYLRKSSCEPILSPSNLEAELKRRKELSDNKTELERRLKALKSGGR